MSIKRALTLINACIIVAALGAAAMFYQLGNSILDLRRMEDRRSATLAQIGRASCRERVLLIV